IYIETARETLLVNDADVAMPESAPDTILVSGTVALPIGRRVVLTGEQWSGAGTTGPVVAEVATVQSCTPTNGNTLVMFQSNIAICYGPTKLGWVPTGAGPRQGETPVGGPELIGWGSASTVSPRFQLKGSPLTYVPDGNPRGYAPAIEVGVNDRLYTEQPTLF